MRLMLFFDLPVETPSEQKTYRQFRKKLIEEGYLMLQKSVYSKLVINENAASAAIDRLRKIRPEKGLVQVLKVTEKQYVSMIYVTGDEVEYDEIDTTDELLII